MKRLIIKGFFLGVYSVILGLYTFVVWIVYRLNQPCEEDFDMWSFQEKITTEDWDEFKLTFYFLAILGYLVIFSFIYSIYKFRKKRK